NIIRLIKSNEDMKTFITLTFEKETDYKESKILLNNLFNKLRRKYNNLKYLWVLEFGTKNQRLHYHLLTNIE
ncbi:rolling circle replication-associated protein, partial [Clostridium perfringens]